MCGDCNAPPAVSTGNAVAAIRSLSSRSSSQPAPFEYVLRISNQLSPVKLTVVTCEDLLPTVGKEDLEVHIYKSSVLNNDSWAISNPIIHSFTINMEDTRDAVGVPMTLLHERLKLDVSDDGIIGRGVAVLKGGKRIGTGVVGWQ